MRRMIATFALALLLVDATCGERSCNAQEAQQGEANLYTSDKLFSERFDPIMDLRKAGDSKRAFQNIETLLAQFEQDRTKSKSNSAGEQRRLVTLALRANLLRDLGRNRESLAAHEALLKLTRNGTAKAERLFHLEILQNHANTLAQLGRRGEALSHKTTVLKEFDELLRKYPDDVTVRLQAATASNNYGTTLVQTGQPRQALAVFNKAMKDLTSIPGTSKARDRKLATLLLNGGVASAYVGNPLQARRFVEEHLAIKTRLKELQTAEAIRARITLGAIYGRLNQYGEAAESYRLAVAQLRDRYPKDRYPDGTADLAVALDNRSVSLVRLRKFAEARTYATEANRMFAALTKKSPGLAINYARSSANLALLNARTGHQADAVENLASAIRIFERAYPQGHAEIPGLYRSQAIIMSELRRPEESIVAVETSLERAEKFFPLAVYPHGNRVHAQTLDTAGVIHLAAGRPKEAASFFLRAVEMQANIARHMLQYVSEAESLQFLAVADTFRSHLLSVPAKPAHAYRALMQEKGRILAQQKSRFALLRETTDPETQRLAERYQQIRLQIARRVLAGKAGPESNRVLTQLQNLREQTERQLVDAGKRSGNNLIASEFKPKSLSTLLKAIPSDTCVIEFFSYEHVTIDDSGPHRRTAGEQRIAAFVLRGSDQSVHRVDLGRALPLRQIVRRMIRSMPFGTEQDPINEISKTLCPPLLAQLSSDCQKITIIPDGIIGSIPFACLKEPKSDKPLVERFEFTVLSSLDRNALPIRQVKRSAQVVAVGGLDYGPKETKSRIQFDGLPGTSKELAAIEKIFDPANVTAHTKSAATEANLLKSLPTAQIIHLATHAYVTDFARDAVTNNDLATGAIRTRADQRSPLLAARVALSSANQNADNAKGLVTGEQFAALDLSKSQLVVLSACESGVGERVLGEGVYGLQRAFHIAGATDVVATLWPVADSDAVAFMELFYKNLVNEGMTPAAALRATQNTIRIREATGGTRRGIKFDIPAKSANKSPMTRTRPSKDSATARSTWAAFFLSRG